jgi:CRP-like cAMP-binding protein
MSDEYLSVLRQSELAADLDEAGLGALARLLVEARYEAGAFIVREGETGDALFILVDGDAAVRKQGGRNEWFREEQIAGLRVGQCFGEMAVIEQDIRSASVQAVSDCVTLSLSRTDLASLKSTQPVAYTQVVWNVASVLASRLRVANHALKEFSPGELRAILARANRRASPV